MLSLRSRFEKFMSQLSGCEEIDNIEIGKEFIGSKKADYLLFNRRVIIELKSLETDTSHKIKAEMSKYETRKEYPLFYGSQKLGKVLAHFPDGKTINRRIYLKITRSIEEAIRNADKQIESTKRIFSLRNSVGLLVVLNENIDVLSPELIGHRFSELLCQKDSGQTLSYNNIQYIWLIAESHHCKLDKEKKAAVSLLIIGPGNENNSRFLSDFELLQKDWAAYNSVPLVYSNEKLLNKLDFVCANSQSENNDNLTRSDLWRLEYSNKPYLRGLSDDDIYEHGKRIFEALAPNFLINGNKLPQEKVKELMIGWTHFLEEANFRGLDLKNLKCNLNDIKSP